MVIHSQRLKREQANGMTEIEKEKKKKKHSISWIEIYLSPEANLLLAGYI